MKRLLVVILFVIGCDDPIVVSTCEQFCASKGGAAHWCAHRPDGKCACIFIAPKARVVIEESK